MSHFYGSVQGHRGEATRLGSKDSGMEARAQGWDVGAQIYICNEDGVDTVYVFLTSGSNGHKTGKQIGRFTAADLT